MGGKCNLLLSILYYLLPLVSLEDSTTLLCSFAFGSVRLRSKGSRIKRMRRIKPPLLSPLGDERSGTGYLGLKLTIRNQRKAPPGRGWGGLKNPSHQGYPWLILKRGERAKGEWAFFYLFSITYYLYLVWKTAPHCCAPSHSAQSARAQKVHG